MINAFYRHFTLAAMFFWSYFTTIAKKQGTCPACKSKVVKYWLWMPHTDDCTVTDHVCWVAQENT